MKFAAKSTELPITVLWLWRLPVTFCMPRLRQHTLIVAVAAPVDFLIDRDGEQCSGLLMVIQKVVDIGGTIVATRFEI